MADNDFKDNLLHFAKQYVEEAGTSFEDVCMGKAWSPLKLIDLKEYTCVRCERKDTGYEIFEYQSPGDELVLLILDTVSGHWIKVE